MTRVFTHPLDLLNAVGVELGASQWIRVDQSRIDAFADATDDHQWIHLDTHRASTGPFGSTIAHGFLSLSLLSAFTASLLEVRNTAIIINYGLDRARFLQPVHSGSRVRAFGTITGSKLSNRGIRVDLQISVEIEGETKPALVADSILLFVPAAT